jgi:hypothetical protein
MLASRDGSNGPPVAVVQPVGQTGGIIADALSQEGIAFLELPVTQMDRLFTGQLPSVRLTIVATLPADPQRAQLRQWVNQGGAAVVMRGDAWPAGELADWFGVQRTVEDTDGGYLWPAAPEITFPAVANQPLQLLGPRMLYTAIPQKAMILAQASAHPTAVVAFDATRDGFSDNEWFWVSRDICKYSRGRSLLEPFNIPGVGPVTPTTAATGDFTGDGFKDDLLIARGNVYAIMRRGVWTDIVPLPYRIKHAMAYDPGVGTSVINLFLEDGSVFIASVDGGRTFSGIQAFIPDPSTGAPMMTDFGYSYEYLDDSGIRRVALNLWSQGAFYTNNGAGWTPIATLPNLGPKYLLANVMRPTLGYASDSERTGVRNKISLLLSSDLYSRDMASGDFNYPQQFHRLYQSGRHPLIARSGRAAVYLYDFERTVAQLQQGQDVDPAVAVQLVQISQTGAPITFSPVINNFDDWVDYCQLDLPQADLHERVLRQVMMSLAGLPLPRIWYLPNGYRSVASLSHDIESAGPNQQATVEASSMQLGQIATASHRRNTFFVLMTSGDAGLMSNSDLAGLAADGHDVTIHFDSFGSLDFTPANFQGQSNLLRGYGVNPINGTRSHGLSWVKDYVSAAIASQPETTYDSTFGGGPGYSHCGSVLPYRLYSTSGSVFETFYEISHGLMDIADSKFFFSGIVPEGQLALQLSDLFDRARDMASKNHDLYYGFFDCLFHPVVVAGLTPPIPEFMDEYAAFVQFLADQQIPSMNMAEFADWWTRRRSLQILGVQWDQARNTLGFTLHAALPVDNATIVMPAGFQGRQLAALTQEGGARVVYQTTVLDGQEYAMAVFPSVQGDTRLIATFS